MWLAVSTLSASGIWIVVDPVTKTLCAHKLWQDDQSSGLAQLIGSKFEELLFESNLKKTQITSLWGGVGPGAFTGLRVSSAFLLGLGHSLKVPVLGIPSFDFSEAPFWIPLQHQKAKSLTLVQALDLKIQFLKIETAKSAKIGEPGLNEMVWGLSDKPSWPGPLELHSALLKNLQNTAFNLNYGSSPKISGKKQ